MKILIRIFLGAVLGLLLSGCSGEIELAGTGAYEPVQDGLQVRFISKGKEGAVFEIKNTSDEIISVNQSPLAVRITALADGKPAVPTGRIINCMHTSPYPDAFVVLTPGQTRTIPVPVSYAGNEYRAHDAAYRMEKGVLYEVRVEFEPYFGTFQPDNADQTLAEFKIPNYRRKVLKANSLTMRAR